MGELVQIAPQARPIVKQDDFWVLAEAACYLRGRGVTFGPPILQAGAINPGVYSIPVALQKSTGVAAQDTDLSIFADGSLDHVLISPMLAAVQDPRKILSQAAAKLKLGGHLVLLTSLTKISPEHHEFVPHLTLALLKEVAHWKLKCDQIENGKHLLILKRVEGRRGIDLPTPRTRPQACVARYGALGDAIIMTPLIRKLSEEGFDVTLNVSSYCAPVFENNPHISNLLIQERDLIPNGMLGRYWQHWEKRYDKYVNLSESLEGDLLLVEGRPPFFTSKEWRHKQCNRNYYDYTMERGGYGEVTGTRGELFFTEAEERRARKFFTPLQDKFTLVWALNGSSHHKVYPMMETVLREWFRTHEDARVITVGDYAARLLEFPHFQMIPQAGKWSIRESLISTKYAQCVVGPETMITNAAGCFSTPKIVLLSHSTRENLTKYFLNDHSLEPDTTVAPCYPCHQLHYSKESCPVGEMQDTVTGGVMGQAPICSIAIAPEVLMAELDKVYNEWKSTNRGASA
jgi:hypothetical protein